MKYFIKSFGYICHYQFSNITEFEVDDVEIRGMDYRELEEKYLMDKCSVENEKISLSDEVWPRATFEVYDNSGKILEFFSDDIQQINEGGDCFCPEPKYNEDYENCLGATQYFKGGGPIFEFEIDNEIKIEKFTYSLFTLELDDREITLIDDLYYDNKKLVSLDSGESWGTTRLVKIWKKNGGVYELEV